MIRTMAIVPVRGRSGGKTRLEPLFDTSERAALVEAMAWHVVSTIQNSGAVDLTVVVSRDHEFRFGPGRPVLNVHHIVQPEHEPGLNAALDFGRKWALEHGAERLLVMFGDLPLLETADLLELTDRRSPVVIAPDRFATGTNGLLLGDPRRSAPGVASGFSFRFGSGSFRDHLAEAKRFGTPVDTASAPGTSFDLDTPEDWDRLPSTVQQRLIGAIRAPGEAHSPTDLAMAHPGIRTEPA